MALLKPTYGGVFLSLFLVLGMGRLAAEYFAIDNQYITILGVPLMWISLSLGFILTLYDIVRRLFAHNVISECLRCRFGWRDLSGLKLFLFLTIVVFTVFAMWDMWFRWDTFHQSWTVDYPWFSQLSLNVGTCLYIVFILLQGLFLSAVALRMDEEMVTESKERGLWESIENLLHANIIFFIYNIVWTLRLIQKESIWYLLSFDVLVLGTLRLIIFHIVSMAVLWIFRLTDPPESVNEAELYHTPDHPTKEFLKLFSILYYTFFALCVTRLGSLYFNLLDTTVLLFLFVPVLVVGIIFVGCKIWLVCKFIVVPNFMSPVSNKYEVKHRQWAGLLVLTMISSLGVIVHLGKDSYDLKHPLQQVPLYQLFLSVYVVAHMLLVLFEGVVAMWQLLFEDIIQYRGQDSAQARNVAKEIHMKCCEASGVFAIYSMLFVLGLPEFGLNAFTLLRLLAGPSFFHLVIAFTYFRFKESCLKQPEQQQQHEVQRMQRNVSMRNVLKDLKHEAKSLLDRYPYKWLTLVYCLLLCLSIIRWLLVSEVMGSQIPTPLQTLTYIIWFTYQGVCYHWLYVMVQYLSCVVVTQRNYSQIWQTVTQCSLHKYPISVCCGIFIFISVALAITSEILRCNLSMSKWTFNNWSLYLGIPLMAVHAAALICQGLLLSGAIMASDTTRNTREEENIPCFADRLGYLLVINVSLLLEHALFIFFTHTDISEPLAFGLIAYHAGSCCIIVILWQTQRKETTVPSDATGDARNESTEMPNPVRLIPEAVLSLCSRLYHLITSEPLQGTTYLIYIIVLLGMARAVDRVLLLTEYRNYLTTEYRNYLTIAFRSFTSCTILLANYYIWKSLTSPTAQSHASAPANGRRWNKLVVCFLFGIVLLGVAEIFCTVIHQMTLANGNLALDTSLFIAGCMNVALVLHEGYAIYLLTIQKLAFGMRPDEPQIIELIITLNLLYAGFGAFNSFLVWTDNISSPLEFDSIVCLLGHVTCSVLMPAMVIPVMERMRENVNQDGPTQAVAEGRNETTEHGSQEGTEISSIPTELN